MVNRSSSIFISKAGSKCLLIAFAVLIAIVCGDPSAPAAASSSSTGKLVVSISPGASGDMFVEPNATVWIYLADLDYRHSHLIGRRYVSGDSRIPNPVVVPVNVGAYRIFLLKYEGNRGRVDGTFCYADVTVTSGSETDIHFPIAPGPSLDPSTGPHCGSHKRDWFAWEHVLLGRDGYAYSGMGDVRVQGDNSPDTFWLDVDKMVSKAQTEFCPKISGPLQEVYRQIVANPPSEPTVFVKGNALGYRRGLPGGLNNDHDMKSRNNLSNMELDADLIRLAVVEIKARCWHWFETIGSRPSGRNAELYDADKATVQSELARLDQLNGIAEILDRVAGEQRQQR